MLNQNKIKNKKKTSYALLLFIYKIKLKKYFKIITVFIGFIVFFLILWLNNNLKIRKKNIFNNKNENNENFIFREKFVLMKICKIYKKRDLKLPLI
jgi:hypothetical protein